MNIKKLNDDINKAQKLIIRFIAIAIIMFGAMHTINTWCQIATTTCSLIFAIILARAFYLDYHFWPWQSLTFYVITVKKLGPKNPKKP